MTSEIHAQAKDFIARRQVEGLALDEETWLNAHLAECESCAHEAGHLAESLSALRTMHIDLPRNLASRTQFRVRMRREELREREPARKFVWAIAGVSWALGVATAPWVWHGIEWFGQATGAPRLLLQAGFALWWSVPPLIAAWAALSEKRAAQPELQE
jgi:sterol desaturase/sphingolipid hydroxylase (fatty acid hydroxylase superfamily)